MIEALFFLGGLSIGWLLLPQPFEIDMKYETGFLNGVKAALNAEKKKMKDGRNALFIEGLFGEESEE
jgi:hypothetical protein